jgi:plastocyanin
MFTLECYSPFEFVTKVGKTVTWANNDIATHTINTNEVFFGENDQEIIFGNGFIQHGETFSHVF